MRVGDDAGRLWLGTLTAWGESRLASAATELWTLSGFLRLLVEQLEALDAGPVMLQAHAIDQLMWLAGGRIGSSSACPAGVYSGVVGERRRHVRERAPLAVRPGGGRTVRARASAGDARPAGHGDARSDPQGRVRARAPDRRSLPARAAGGDRPHSFPLLSRSRQPQRARPRPVGRALVVRHVRVRQCVRRDGLGRARRTGRAARKPGRDRGPQLRFRHRARPRVRSRLQRAGGLRRHPRRRRRLRLATAVGRHPRFHQGAGAPEQEGRPRAGGDRRAHRQRSRSRTSARSSTVPPTSTSAA